MWRERQSDLSRSFQGSKVLLISFQNMIDQEKKRKCVMDCREINKMFFLRKDSFNRFNGNISVIDSCSLALHYHRHDKATTDIKMGK